MPQTRRTRERPLHGQVTVITGASSGVGRAMVRTFATAGARLVLIARGRDGLAAAAREAEDAGSHVLVFAVDVASAEAVDGVAARVMETWGAIDVWVNNAMVSVFSPAHLSTASEYRRVMEVNYLGYVHGTLAALRHMRPRGRGVVVQIGSALTYRSIPLQSAYCASKAAIRGFTDSLRSELIRENSGVQLTMVQLPAVNTPQFEVVRNRLPGHPRPVPPIFQPEHIARVVLRTVLRPRREVWIGWSTTKAILGQRVFPGLLDRYLARHGWDSQTTQDVPEGHPHRHRMDNLDEPLPGDRGAHGPFDHQVRRSRSRRGWMLGAGAVLAAGVVLAARSR